MGRSLGLQIVQREAAMESRRRVSAAADECQIRKQNGSTQMRILQLLERGIFLQRVADCHEALHLAANADVIAGEAAMELGRMVSGC